MLQAYAAVLTVFVILSITEFCLETQPGFYIAVTQNNTNCDWDPSITNIYLAKPVRWV